MATAILRWLYARQIETAFIDPGKPWQNDTERSAIGSTVLPTFDLVTQPCQK